MFGAASRAKYAPGVQQAWSPSSQRSNQTQDTAEDGAADLQKVNYIWRTQLADVVLLINRCRQLSIVMTHAHVMIISRVLASVALKMCEKSAAWRVKLIDLFRNNSRIMVSELTYTLKCSKLWQSSSFCCFYVSFLNGLEDSHLFAHWLQLF